MNKKIAVLLIIALILSLVDSLATYLEISHGKVLEIWPLPRSIQENIGLDGWLYWHITIFLLVAIALCLAIYKKVHWPVYLWLVIEIIVCLIHCYGLFFIQ